MKTAVWAWFRAPLTGSKSVRAYRALKIRDDSVRQRPRFSDALTHVSTWIASAYSATMLMAVTLALWAGSGPAGAETEYVASDGKLTQLAFYRSVACGGAEIDKCQSILLRWPAHLRRDLRVGLSQIGADIPGKTRSLVIAALRRAVSEINTAGADITLTIANGRHAHDAEIQLFLVNPDRQGKIKQVQSPLLRDQVLSSGLTRMRHKGREILGVHVGLSGRMQPDAIQSVVLEELVQSLGLMTDILNPHYRHRSVFAEDCDCTTELTGHDRAVLLMHYPPVN